MTDRERKLFIGLLAKVYTHTLDTDKPLDEQVEDCISLGEALSFASARGDFKEDKVNQQIKTCKDEIKDLKYQIHINRMLSLLPKTNVMPFFNL